MAVDVRFSHNTAIKLLLKSCYAQAYNDVSQDLSRAPQLPHL